MPAGCVTTHFEMSGKETHKRKACWMYDKTFVNRTDQKCHKKMCTGEKPYACGMCNETFVNWTDQKCHAKIPTGEKPFVSMMCEHSEMSRSTTLTETLDLALRFKEPSFIILYHKASFTTLTTNPLTHKLQRNGYSSCFH